MPKNDIQEQLNKFSDGSGFGDPDARRNAELHLNAAIAKEQQNTAKRLNRLTFLLVFVGLLNAAILAIQLFK